MKAATEMVKHVAAQLIFAASPLKGQFLLETVNEKL